MTDIYSLFRRKKIYRFDFFDELNKHLSKYPELSFYSGVAFDNHITLVSSVGTLRIPYPNVTTQAISIEFFKRPPRTETFHGIEEALCEMNRYFQRGNRIDKETLSDVIFTGGGIGINIIRNGKQHL